MDIAINIIYDLKFVGPLEFELVAPMQEELKTTTMHFYKAITKHIKSCQPKNVSYPQLTTTVVVPVCSGMGATKRKFLVLRS